MFTTCIRAVSYTHLDVYKRQGLLCSLKQSIWELVLVNVSVKSSGYVVLSFYADSRFTTVRLNVLFLSIL